MTPDDAFLPPAQAMAIALAEAKDNAAVQTLAVRWHLANNGRCAFTQVLQPSKDDQLSPYHPLTGFMAPWTDALAALLHRAEPAFCVFEFDPHVLPARDGALRRAARRGQAHEPRLRAAFDLLSLAMLAEAARRSDDPTNTLRFTLWPAARGNWRRSHDRLPGWAESAVAGIFGNWLHGVVRFALHLNKPALSAHAKAALHHEIEETQRRLQKDGANHGARTNGSSPKRPS